MSTLHAFEMPEDDAALPGWLERQLAGPHLGELVAELSALRESGPSSLRPDDGNRRSRSAATLEAVLGNRLPQICDNGLTGVPVANLRRLFRHPELLVEMQSHVLTLGGEYWEGKLAESAELAEMVKAGWSRLEPRLRSTAPESAVPDTFQSEAEGSRGRAPFLAVETVPAGSLVKRPARPVRWFLAGALSAAAVAVAGIFVWDRAHGPQAPAVAASGWGWNRADAFSQGTTRSEYLKALANSAEEWRKKRPETPQALAQRINEFREGCSRLILAEHKPLPAADRKWLVERCRTWAKKLDDQLADLEAGKPVAAVRGQVDETVDRLTKALRDRAAQPSPA